MKNNEYSRQFVKGISARIIKENYNTGRTIPFEAETVIIDVEQKLPFKVDYTNDAEIEVLATSAVHTADGLYDLVKRNCCTSTPDNSYDAYLEMYLALAGLACEIYMKAIIYHEKLHRGKIVKEHNLNELFKRLPPKQKTIIVERIDNIKTILPTIRDMFTTLRYNFEKNNINGEYLLVFDLMEELRIIANEYPKIKHSIVSCASGIMRFE